MILCIHELLILHRDCTFGNCTAYSFPSQGMCALAYPASGIIICSLWEGLMSLLCLSLIMCNKSCLSAISLELVLSILKSVYSIFAAKVTCLDSASSYLFLSGAVLVTTLIAAVCKQHRLWFIRHKVMFMSLFAVLFSLFLWGCIFSQVCGSLSAQKPQEHRSEVIKLSLHQASSGPQALGVQAVWKHLCCSGNAKLCRDLSESEP